MCEQLLQVMTLNIFCSTSRFEAEQNNSLNSQLLLCLVVFTLTNNAGLERITAITIFNYINEIFGCWKIGHLDEIRAFSEYFYEPLFSFFF